MKEEKQKDIIKDLIDIRQYFFAGIDLKSKIRSKQTNQFMGIDPAVESMGVCNLWVSDDKFLLSGMVLGRAKKTGRLGDFLFGLGKFFCQYSNPKIVLLEYPFSISRGSELFQVVGAIRGAVLNTLLLSTTEIRKFFCGKGIQRKEDFHEEILACPPTKKAARVFEEFERQYPQIWEHNKDFLDAVVHAMIAADLKKYLLGQRRFFCVGEMASKSKLSFQLGLVGRKEVEGVAKGARINA